MPRVRTEGDSFYIVFPSAEPLELFAVRAEDERAARAGPSGRRVLVAGAAVIALGLVAVAGLAIAQLPAGGLGSSPGTVSPSAAASPASPTAAAASLIVVPTLDPEAGPPEPDQLAPGRYCLALFDPAFEFTVPDGWYAARDYPDGFEPALGLHESFVGYLSGAKVQVVFTDGCLEGETDAVEQTPGALMDWLRANPYVAVTNVTAVNVDRYSGLSAIVEQAKAARAMRRHR